LALQALPARHPHEDRKPAEGTDRLEQEMIMSTITFATTQAAPARPEAASRTTTEVAAPKRRGFFGRYFDALIASRQAQAERAVASHMTQYSDAQLESFGHSPADIAYLRGLAEKPRSEPLV
jgi:hypothetical protein